MDDKVKDCIGRLERYKRECEGVTVNARGAFAEWCKAYLDDLGNEITSMRSGDFTEESAVDLAESHLRYKVGL